MNKENQVNTNSGAIAAENGTVKHCDLKSTRPHQQAANYVAQVKAALGSKSTQYYSFSQTLKDFTTKALSAQEVTQRIHNLFQGHEHQHLILGFNQFLPTECKVIIPPPEELEKRKETRISYDEDPPLETELLAVKEWQHELVGLKAKKRLLQQNGLVSSRKKQDVEDVAWDIVCTQEAISNVLLGIKLRSKDAAKRNPSQHVAFPSKSPSKDQVLKRHPGNKCGAKCQEEMSPDLEPARVSLDITDESMIPQGNADTNLPTPKTENKTTSYAPVKLPDAVDDETIVAEQKKPCSGTLDCIKWLVGNSSAKQDQHSDSRSNYKKTDHSSSLSALQQYESPVKPVKEKRRSHMEKQCKTTTPMFRQSSSLRKINAPEAFENSIVPSAIVAAYSGDFLGELVEDPVEEGRYVTDWSDAEKCMFLDKFLHHPKDFRKIASSQRKNVKECIEHYYLSKKVIPYKQALKEFRQWKKSRGDVVFWEAVVRSLLAVRAITKDTSGSYILPDIDVSSHTEPFQRMRLAVFESLTSAAKVSRAARASRRNPKVEVEKKTSLSKAAVGNSNRARRRKKSSEGKRKSKPKDLSGFEGDRGFL